MRLGIIGGGRAAWAFGSAWVAAGNAVAGVALRERSRSAVPSLLSAPRVTSEELLAHADIVFVAASDDALPALCAELASRAPRELWLFHASGSLPASLFAPHTRAFSLHPLRALPPPGVPRALDGVLLAFEGEPDARSVADEIATRANARIATVPAAAKPAYHAAAVMAANCPAALLSLAERLLDDAGIEGVGAGDLAALALSAIENWRKNVGNDRFTGPAARGDEAVLRKHLEVLAARPTMRAAYASLALALCEFVLEQDPDNARVKGVQQALRSAPLP